MIYRRRIFEKAETKIAAANLMRMRAQARAIADVLLTYGIRQIWVFSRHEGEKRADQVKLLAIRRCASRYRQARSVP